MPLKSYINTMKNSQKNLLRLAQKFGDKYSLSKFADIDAGTIQETIQETVKNNLINASGNPSSGIMPFMQIIKDQQIAGLRVSVDRTGKNISVDVGLNFPNNQVLAEQIKQYLTKNLELFPSRSGGEPINYDNFSMNLSFP